MLNISTHFSSPILLACIKSNVTTCNRHKPQRSLSCRPSGRRTDVSRYRFNIPHGQCTLNLSSTATCTAKPRHNVKPRLPRCKLTFRFLLEDGRTDEFFFFFSAEAHFKFSDSETSSRTATKVWSSSLGVGRGANNSSR
jgi:hypothetical protein